MAGIPPSLDSDTEDVAWALQTAEALWKRGERQDAVVWLRRAAQSAGDAEDDDRALSLARNAAELAEWLTRQATQTPSLRASARRSGAPPQRVAPAPLLPPMNTELEAPRAAAEEEEATSPRMAFPPVMAFPSAVMTLPLPPPMPPQTASMPPPQSGSMAPAPPVAPPPLPSVASVGPRPPPPPPMPSRSPPPPPPLGGVRSPPAMPAAALVPSRSPSPPPPPPAPPVAAAPARSPSPPPPAFTTEVPTAAEAHAGILDPWADAPDDQGQPRTPHDGVRRAGEGPRFDADEIVTSAPPVAKVQPKVAASVERVPSPPSLRVVPPQPPTTPRAIPEPPSSPRGGASEPPGLDLSEVDALSDLPDDARRAFSRRAKVRDLVRRDEVSDFALALVLEGRVEVAATLVDSPAMRLETGAVLRARGTIDSVAPLRLIAASDTCRIALWTERDVAEAFRSCPWVEDELRVAGNQTQAMVGVTLGALGERLDPLLRANLTDRMRLRVLGDHEVFAKAGTAIPGLLVVGGGELELVGKDGTPTGAVLRAGDFLFPNEVLRAAPAPSSVRAARGGAIILVAERGIAQELLVTCPPLLEIFSSA